MSANSLVQDHSRSFHDNKFVYPVLSRRSKGMSIGVNLNPDKVCNFDCIYCQVDRVSESETRFVESERLIAELTEMFELVSSGRLFNDSKFQHVPEQLRRLNDIAFSGDGEPTTFRNFDWLMDTVAELKSIAGLGDVKMVLITNASMFHRPVVQRGLMTLDDNNGEIWAKLDAGTDEYYQLVERTRIPFQQILDNIKLAAQVRPLVIQSLFMRIDDQPPTDGEIDAYCDRLSEVIRDGGELKLVQVYTVARRPAESFVTPLEEDEVEGIARQVREQVGVAAEAFV